MLGEIGFGQKVGALSTRGLSECRVREWMGEGARADRERDLKLHSHDGVGMDWGRQDVLILRQRGKGSGEGGMKSRARPASF